MPPAGACDRVPRPLGSLALALDRDRLDEAALDQAAEQGVDRAELDREPESQAVVVEDLLDPVAVQRLLGQQPEDEEPREDVRLNTKVLVLNQADGTRG